MLLRRVLFPLVSRRRFLQILSGVALIGRGFSPLAASQVTNRRPQGHRPRSRAEQGTRGPLAKFVDPLPLPSTMDPVSVSNGTPVFEVTMSQLRRKLHRDLAPATLWGYNGQYPGPTFETRRGQPILVTWRNNLPAAHLFLRDPTIHGAEPPTPEVRTVVHLHGGKVLPEHDGHPDAWFTNGFAQTGSSFTTRMHSYPNDQPAATLWYHDHALGITRLNVYAGLAGFYLIRDDAEDGLNLPRGQFEIPLVIQDRSLNADGSLFYPQQRSRDPEIPPIWIPEFFGDTVLVNGMVWPFLEVEPRKYRFRILNGSNARFYHVTLHESRENGERLGRPGPRFVQIGTDGGFLPAPVTLTDLTIAPGERCDVVVDFSGADGKFFVLANDAKAPFPDGDDVVPPDVMLFKVTKRLGRRDTSAIPASLPAPAALDPASAVKVRDLVLIERASAEGNPIEALINTHFMQPVTETPRAGSTEIWRIINTTEDAHPIHLHLVQFQILDRQPFDVERFPPRLGFTGPPVPAPSHERGAPKDIVKAFPGEVTRLIARFDLPTGTRIGRGDRFRYVFHCHTLEHEDNEMMRPYDVVG